MADPGMRRRSWGRYMCWACLRHFHASFQSCKTSCSYPVRAEEKKTGVPFPRLMLHNWSCRAESFAKPDGMPCVSQNWWLIPDPALYPKDFLGDKWSRMAQISGRPSSPNICYTDNWEKGWHWRSEDSRIEAKSAASKLWADEFTLIRERRNLILVISKTEITDVRPGIYTRR